MLAMKTHTVTAWFAVLFLIARAGALGCSDIGSVPADQFAEHGAAKYGVAFGICAERPQVRVGDEIVLATAFVNDAPRPIWLRRGTLLGYHYSVVLHAGGTTIALGPDSRKGAYLERMGDGRVHLLPNEAALEPLVLTDMFTVPRAGTLDVTVTVDAFPTMGSSLPTFSLQSNTVRIQILPR
jgi:hypothetical protein